MDNRFSKPHQDEIKPCNSSNQWPQTLMLQHTQLDAEINTIKTLLTHNQSTFFQLDVHIKKLIKGLIVHLELESYFLSPMAISNSLEEHKLAQLNQGYEALLKTCQDTSDYTHSLKISCGNCSVNTEQSERLLGFLAAINQRLNDENVIYAQM